MSGTTDVLANVPVSSIDPDPDQPRRWIDPDALAELVASITANGMVSPIRVRPSGDRYVIVHGERRWRAAVAAGWTEVPAVVADVDTADVAWHQLVENVNRADLTVVEEALAYRAAFRAGATHAQIAARIGKSRTVITQKLRVLELPESVVLLLSRGLLSEGHARQLLRVRALYTDDHVRGVSRDTDPPMAHEVVDALWADTVVNDRAVANVSLQLMSAARPLDWPVGFPIDLTGQRDLWDSTLAHWHALVDAPDTGYPTWWDVAWYWACTAVRYRLSVANLARVIDKFIEHIHSAIIMTIGGRPSPKSPDWSYLSDLRHAGLDESHGHLVPDALALLGPLDVDMETSVLVPSIFQPGAPRSTEGGAS